MNQKYFIVYNSITGEIFYSGTAEPSKHSEQANPEKNLDVISWEAGADWDSSNIHQKYIENNTVQDRHTTAITLDKTEIDADGVDAVELLNILEGSEVYIYGPVDGQYTVDDSNSFKLSTETDGLYTIIVKNFPDTDFIGTINAS